MKHNPLVTIGLIAAWVIVFTLLIELHWRPARLMLPIVSIILLVYIVTCTVYAIIQWLNKGKEQEKKDASVHQVQSGSGTGGDSSAKPE